MDNIINKIFKIIEYTFDKKLSKLQAKIEKNRDDLAEISAMKDNLHEKIMDLHRSQNDEITALDQIELMFRMLEKDPFTEQMLAQDHKMVRPSSFELLAGGI